MRICVYGAGAVGGVIAAWLARAGHETCAVARGPHLDAIRRDGLRVIGRASGEPLTARVAAESDPAKLGPQDAVIVTVKAHSLPEVAGRIGPLLGADTTIVTAMNGVPWWWFDRLPAAKGRKLASLDPDGRLARAMPTERIVGCVLHIAASTPEPGVVDHSMGKRLILGEPGGNNTVRTASIVAALTSAGFDCVTSPLIEKDFWVKLLGNASFNPVSVLTLATTDRLLRDPQVKAYMLAVMRELIAVGRAVGVDAAIEPEARMDMALALGKFKTSMLQDLEAGRPLEIDGLLTGTLEVAQFAGVAAPFTAGLLGMIRLRAATSGQYPAAGA